MIKEIFLTVKYIRFYLDLDDDWIYLLRDKMREFGYEDPPYFLGPQSVGAHVTILPSGLSRKMTYEEKNLLVGRKVTFEVDRAGVSFPRVQHYGMEAEYKIWIESKELEKIHRTFSRANAKPQRFFIIVGVRRIKKVLSDSSEED